MKRILFIYLLFFTHIAIGQERTLSDSAQISLLTCSPGEELYSAFGHTGIRVTDFKNEFDVVFNYGTFDFEQPGFYTNFIRGRMLYCLAVDRYDNFRQQYIYEDRRVEEQILNLNTEDKKKIFAALFENAKEENRNYRYDFFWDNCCTRPRDVFEKALGDRLTYDYTVLNSDMTMRDALKPWVANKPWVDFGFDLILGLPCEVPATPRNQTFLPSALQTLIQGATMDGKPFVQEEKVIVDLPFSPKKFEGIHPLLVTLAIMMFGLLLIFFERWKKTHFWWFDFTLFFITGLLGTFFLGMWFFTEHYSVPKNLNVLWLLPSHLVVSFYLLRSHKSKWLSVYFILTFVSLIILLATWGRLPQPFNIAVLPMIVLMANRALRIFLYFKLQQIGERK